MKIFRFVPVLQGLYRGNRLSGANKEAAATRL